MPGLLRIVYASDRPSALNEAGVAAILAQATAHNVQHGVTGVLLTYSTWFLQLLEGPEEVVAPLFERISRDTRHDNVTLLERGTIEAPLCPAWGMIRVTDKRELALLAQSITGKAAFDPRTAASEHLPLLMLAAAQRVLAAPGQASQDCVLLA